MGVERWIGRPSPFLVPFLIVAACVRPTEKPAFVPQAKAYVQSNILRGDYAGSAACGDCHAAIYERWQQSPMHRMTRVSRDADIQAPFDGSVLRVGSDTATMETREAKRYVTLASTTDGRHVYRVTKVIGGRYREDYVGVDVTDVDDAATAWGVERILPVSFVYSTRSWRYKGYSVMVTERDGMRVQVPWSKTCIPCHNTLPYLTMIYDELLGPAAPSYQGRLSDDLLPMSRVWSYQAVDERALAFSITDEVARIGGTAPDASAPLPKVLRQAIIQTRAELGGGDLVEVGVGCETCPCPFLTLLTGAAHISTVLHIFRRSFSSGTSRQGHAGTVRRSQVLAQRPFSVSARWRQQITHACRPIYRRAGRRMLRNGCAGSISSSISRHRAGPS